MLRRHAGRLILVRWGQKVELPCVDFIPDDGTSGVSDAAILIPPGDHVIGTLHFKKVIDLPAVDLFEKCKSILMLEFGGYRKAAKVHLPIDWNSISVSTEAPKELAPASETNQLGHILEPSAGCDVVRDAYLTLIRAARDACTALLQSPSAQMREVADDRFEVLNRFLTNSGEDCFDQCARDLLMDGLAALAEGLEETVISIDPAGITWRFPIQRFIDTAEIIESRIDSGIPLKISDCANELLDVVESDGIFEIRQIGEGPHASRLVCTSSGRPFFDSRDLAKRVEYLEALTKELSSLGLVASEPTDDPRAERFDLTSKGWSEDKVRARLNFDRILRQHGQLNHNQERLLRALCECQNSPPGTDCLEVLRRTTSFLQWNLTNFREAADKLPAGYWNGNPTFDAHRYFRAKRILGL